MKILVDADACPNVIKEIIFRAGKRLKIQTLLFANHTLRIPPSPYIKFILVSKGFDVADNEIEQLIAPGDLVVTADIPLANSVIDKQAAALNPRGMFYTKENIKETLQMRNLMSELRDSGKISGGPAPLDKKNQQAFANALDRYLAQQHKL